MLEGGLALEVAGAGVVQLPHDPPLDQSAGEGDVGGGDRPLELARDADVDLLSGEPPSELRRLRAAAGRQARWPLRIRVDRADDVRLALRVADDQEVHCRAFAPAGGAGLERRFARCQVQAYLALDALQGVVDRLRVALEPLADRLI